MTNSGGDDSGRWQEIANILGADSRDELSDYFGGTTKRTSDAEGPVEIEIEIVDEEASDASDPEVVDEMADRSADEVVEQVVVESGSTAGELDESDLVFTRDEEEPVKTKRTEKKRTEKKPAKKTAAKPKTSEASRVEQVAHAAVPAKPGHWNDLPGELGL